MLKIKPGAALASLHPAMGLAAVIVHECYANHGAMCVITSGDDSKHAEQSLHYVGCALDFRIREPSSGASVFPALADQTKAIDEIVSALGPHFDVVLERDHLHVEFQPRYSAIAK